VLTQCVEVELELELDRRRFQDSKTPKNVLFNMTLIALDDVIFKIEVHILNGMWLPAVDFFRCRLGVRFLEFLNLNFGKTASS